MAEPRSNTTLVEVTFIDGEVKTYTITAGIGIGQYLAREASQTGILVLFNDEASHGVPLAQVREYVLRPAPEEGAASFAGECSDSCQGACPNCRGRLT